MASISRVLSRIKDELHELLPAGDIERLCRDIKYNYRRRKLDPVVTIHLFIQQVLHCNTAITHLPHLSDVKFDPSAYCTARKRLPLKVFQELLKHIGAAVRDHPARGLWIGHRVCLVDGSSSSMPDTPGLQAEFGQSGKQAPGCGFPITKLLGVFDAQTGMILDLLADKFRTHEMSRVSGLHGWLSAGDVLVGDRGFCSYAHLAALVRLGIHGVFRLHQRYIVEFKTRPNRLTGRKRKKREKEKRARGKKARRGRTRSRLVKVVGEQDQIVEWAKPRKKPGWMSQAEFDALPETITVRELRYRICEAGTRTKVVTLVTTLLDAKTYTRAELSKLYKLRWQVEQDWRDMKTTLGMEVLKCKSVDGVRKEMIVYAVVYNLVCLVRARAAEKQETPADRISFIDVLRWLQTAQPWEEIPKFVVNPLRPNRHEPRVIKRRPKQYDLMKKPRAEYKKTLVSPRKAA
jgi:hypothetical protein